MSLLALLAAQAGESGWSLGTSADPVWVPPGALDTWRASRDNATNELVEVAYMGDSTSFGQVNSGGAPGTAYPTAYMVREHALTAGYKDGGIGHFTPMQPDIPSPFTLSPLVGSSGAESYIQGFGSQVRTGYMVDQDGDTITWRGEGRYARVIYARNGQLFGSFDVSVDGSVVTTIASANTTSNPDLYETTWVDLGSNGAHEITFTALGTGAGGWNKVNADIEWLGPDLTGIVWHRDGVSGAQSTNGVSTHAAYTLGLRAGVEGTHPLARRTRLAINVYGINDQQQTADRSTFLRDSLRTFVDYSRAAGADPVLCIPLYERANQKNTVDAGFTEVRSVRFRQIHRDVAIEKGCALVDLGSGGALAGTESEWGSVDPHLSVTLYQMQADHLWDELLSL